jgi:hypothetical protein
MQAQQRAPACTVRLNFKSQNRKSFVLWVECLEIFDFSAEIAEFFEIIFIFAVCETFRSVRNFLRRSQPQDCRIISPAASLARSNIASREWKDAGPRPNKLLPTARAQDASISMPKLVCCVARPAQA